MNRYNQARGRGTGERAFFPRVRIKSEGNKEGELISANSENAVSPVPRPLSEAAELAAYLAANPGMTPRDFKGKGFTIYNPFDKYYERPNEEPWHQLKREDVRRIATSTKARFLPRNIRQAAARDPGLEWDAQSLAYRLRAAGPRAPFPANEASDRAGGLKSLEPASRQTGGGHEKKCKHPNRGEKS